MKTVEIKIKVKVPDSFKWVTVDWSGQPCAFQTKPTLDGCNWVGRMGDGGLVRYANNWEETLTKVK